MMKRFLTALILLILLSHNVFGWGGDGHKIIVAIAERHLTEKARANIGHYIPIERLIDESCYMDAHRKDSNLLYAYNFHEQCVNLETLEYDPNQHVDCGDISRAVWLANYNLSHLDAISDSIAQLNIRMLLHFVGEVHCPVHLGIPSIWQPRPPFRQDMGKWYWNGKNIRSFHTFIDRSPKLLFPGKTPEQIAGLIDNVSRKEARKYVKGDFIDWTNDAIKRGFRIYDTYPPLWEIPDTPEKKVIPDGYLEEIRDVIIEELIKGGYQMAFLLNKYFDI